MPNAILRTGRLLTPVMPQPSWRMRAIMSWIGHVARRHENRRCYRPSCVAGRTKEEARALRRAIQSEREARV